MRSLRSVLVFFWMAVTVIPFASVIIICAPFIGPDARWWYLARPWLQGAVEAVRLVGGIQYTVIGEEHLPAAGDNQRIILCPKHQSTWETFFFASRMPRPLAYVFKRELLYVPFFGWAMACLNMIHIDRGARGDAWKKVASLGEALMDRANGSSCFLRARGLSGVARGSIRRARRDSRLPRARVLFRSPLRQPDAGREKALLSYQAWLTCLLDHLLRPNPAKAPAN